MASWLQRVQWGLCGRDTADLHRLPPRPPRPAACAASTPSTQACPGEDVPHTSSLQRSRQGAPGTHPTAWSRGKPCCPKQQEKTGATANTTSTPTVVNHPLPRDRGWDPLGTACGSLEARLREASPQPPAQHPHPGRRLAPGPSGCLPASAARPRVGAGRVLCASALGERWVPARSGGRGFWGSVWVSVPRGTVSPSQSSSRGGPGRGLPDGGCVPLQQDPLGSCRGGHRGTGAAPAPTASAGSPAPGSSGERLSRAS